MHDVARSDDERRAELERPLAGLVDPVSCAPRANRCTVRFRAEDLPRVPTLDTRGARSVGVVVDENRERDVLLLHELASMQLVPGADREDLRTARSDLLISVAHLRGVLPAVQSAEVAEENEDDRTIRPVVPEAMILAVGAGQDEIGQSVDVHGRGILAACSGFLHQAGWELCMQEVVHMTTIEESIEVQAPVRTVYNQWTQFEEFPRFMEGVEEVKQVDDTHLQWKAKIAGQTRDWEARITEQKPDDRIAWTSEDGAHNAGVVTFHKLDDNTTRVMLQLEFKPEGLVEKVGDQLDVVRIRTKGDMKRFKAFIEERGRETGAWRGTVENN